jgi:hypothetical protein
MVTGSTQAVFFEFKPGFVHPERLIVKMTGAAMLVLLRFVVDEHGFVCLENIVGAVTGPTFGGVVPNSGM